jgi:hypothetical protein
MRERLVLACTLIGLFACASFAVPDRSHAVASGKAPIIAADSNGHLHAVFEGLEPGWKYQDIFYCQSVDGGVSWSAPEDISNTPASSVHPGIAVEQSGALDVVWCDTKSGDTSPDVFFVRSTDGGKTWTKPKDISNTPGVSSQPALATGSDNSIHVVWCDTSKGEKNKDIYYCASNDGGKTFSKDPLLPCIDISNTPGASNAPTIAVCEDGSVHAAWEDTTSGATKPDIYYAMSENGTWSKPIDVSKTPGVSRHPSIACGTKGKVYLAWADSSDKPTAPDIWFALARKHGTFEEPINLSDTPGLSGDPSVAADQKNHVCVVWSDTSENSTKPDIFGRVSLDGGDDFSNIMELADLPGYSKHPIAAIAGDKLFAIWANVQGAKSMVKVLSMGIQDIATGPVEGVDQPVHPVPSDSR